MKLVVHGKNLEVTPALRDYVEKRLKKLERLLPTVTEAVVNLEIEKHNHKVEVLLRADGVTIQAEGITGEIYSSVDEATDKLQRQINKYKGKNMSHRNKNKPVSASASSEEVSPPETMIIRETIETKPMSPEEAAMQMDMMGKDFLVFPNEKTGQINVIYRRRDGHLGLIEPA